MEKEKVKKDPTHILDHIGVKPAESKLHEYLRVSAVIILIGLISWIIFQESNEMDDEEEIEQYIKKDTIINNSINELDPACRKKYIKFLKKTFDEKHETVLYKFYKSIGIALAAGIFSEYIINGNLYKPIGIVGKTTLYTMFNNLLTL